VLNGFSVDVEEWFHVCGAPAAIGRPHWTTLPCRVEATTARVLDLLDRRGVRATFFVLGWVAERFPRLVDSIVRAGHIVGSHGHTHDRVYELEPHAFAVDIEASLISLTAAGSGPVTCYRAPEWSINERAPWALAALARAGITLDSSRAPMRIVGDPTYPTAPHRIHTACGDLIEVPPFVTRWFGQSIPYGGGWGLRLARTRSVVRAVDAANRAGVPATFWIHPWELDPDPPRVRLPWAVQWAHYVGLPGFERRLDEILRQVAFGPLQEAIRCASA
jgi:polysaccharide deacetylase family protein (PEP-CTERM system associated)